MLSSKQVECIKERYPKGTLIELENMEGEDMPTGTRGTVRLVDDAGQIHMNWENGRGLALNTEVDSFRVIRQEENHTQGHPANQTETTASEQKASEPAEPEEGQILTGLV